MENQWLKIVKLFRPPELFLDIGVARVDTEAWMCKRDWATTTIIGFEPCQSRYSKIKGYPGQLLPIIVSDVKGVKKGWENNYDFKTSREYDDADPYAPTAHPSTTVDAILNELQYKTVFLWADTEGSEMLILKGAMESLKSHKIVGLNLELWPNEKKSTVGWANDHEIVQFLKGFGYVCDNYESWDRIGATDFIFHLQDGSYTHLTGIAKEGYEGDKGYAILQYKKDGEPEGKVYETSIQFLTVFEKIKKHINKLDNVLDIGCGNGRLSFQLSKQFKNVLAIDQFDYYDKKFISNNIRFQQVWYRDFESDIKFDMIMFWRIFYILRDYTEGMQKAKRLLSENGKIVIVENAFRNVDNNLEKTETCYSLSTILKKTDLTLIDSFYINNDISKSDFICYIIGGIKCVFAALAVDLSEVMLSMSWLVEDIVCMA